MLTRNEVWQLLEGICQQEGVELFDVDYPANRAGVLRVFISRRPGEGGVDLDDCARVSRQISDTSEMEGFLGEDCTLEVSSPGINRRLSRLEHFERAVGERVRVTYLDPEQGKRSMTGQLTSVKEAVLEVEDEHLGAAVHVAFANVESARVDFLFTRKSEKT